MVLSNIRESLSNQNREILIRLLNHAETSDVFFRAGDRGPSPWGVQPLMPLVWRQPGAMCLGGDRRSPGLSSRRRGGVLLGTE